MKFPVFTRVIAFSGLAAGAVLAASAQQPASPATPASKAPGSVVHLPPGAQAPKSPPAAPASNLAPDGVVITIGERKMTRAQFELLLASIAQNGHAASTAAEKRKVAEQYGELETMATEARKRMLDQNPETKQMLAIQTDNVLASLLAKKLSEETQLTDPDLRAYYDAHKDD